MGFDPKLAVVAIGGNATFPPTIRGTAEEQFEIVNHSCEHLVQMLESGYRLVLTHGNGPVVGNILIRMAMASSVIAPMPMDICVADSQGGIGYIIQQCLLNRLQERGIQTPVVSLVTQVEVRVDDPAFQHPSKPIGPFYSQEEAERLGRETGWEMQEDAGRGYRRVVPSPHPVTILELEAVRRLVEAGVIPIAAGGGGIPVIHGPDGRYHGMDAVIDKDLASALLALGLRAGIFLILTGVDSVALDFGKPTQRSVASLSVKEARALLAAGQFPEGSMGPKIRAALEYVEGGGDTVIITSLEHALDALQGETGTRFFP
jgi:carbamate kinase